ncbi:aspartate aminotransferase family protein [Paenibacillus hemerocallicola]|jgi:glutamate-1-semialdehyde 2,1-aminomutase|uniref:Aspartate aminotransferase family protein n=1 Tax=Paenibacillus hemerocallicola TaxID=1172614 RepID=A0A5C4TIN2_9BACL|nr:aspartate aminotransferase family protein [Paenibacillus hemerocallicola]TNJ68289.1 aspartate aminotransferase family protein [Paenibacillus hemerocallicola]
MKTFEKSRAKLAEAKQVLAGGVASTLRGSMKPTPLYVESASGVTVKDVDGNEYLDYQLAYGPLILGHAHPGFNEKVSKAMAKGITYGLQHDGEIELARRLTEVLPCADKVVLSGSGTEAVMLALRLSRAYTGKSKVVRFHGHYHGWSDSIFTSFPSPDMMQKATSAAADSVPPGTKGQSELSLQDVILLPWNEPETLEATLRAHAHEIAAVISEPVMCNSGCILPLPGYLEQIRELTRELNIVFIMDEVITGFRLSPGGAHGRFGINPDLVTVGKALGGGIAVSAVGGRKEIFELIDSEQVSHLGTLNGNGVATSSALAVLELLTENDGAVYGKMEDNAIKLATGIRVLFEKHGHRGVVNQIGPVFHFMFIEEDEVTHFDTFQKRNSGKYAKFAELMLDEGVLVRPNGLWYISTVHEADHIEKTLQAIDRVFVRLTEGN